MKYSKSLVKSIRYQIAAVHKMADGTTEVHWLDEEACRQFMLDLIKKEITSECGISAEAWLARAAELRYREQVRELWKHVDKRHVDGLPLH